MATKARLVSMKFFDQLAANAVEEQFTQCAVEAINEGLARARASMKKSQAGEPSAPGTPPNIQTGNLAESMAAISTTKGVAIRMAFYGWIHERGGSKHPRRPFIEPILPDIRKALRERFKWHGIQNTRAGRRLIAQVATQAKTWMDWSKSRAAFAMKRTSGGQFKEKW
jgi:hypothetical protein